MRILFMPSLNMLTVSSADFVRLAENSMEAEATIDF